MVADHTRVNESAVALVPKLVKVRPAFVAHLEHARRLQTGLMK